MTGILRRATMSRSMGVADPRGYSLHHGIDWLKKKTRRPKKNFISTNHKVPVCTQSN